MSKKDVFPMRTRNFLVCSFCWAPEGIWELVELNFNLGSNSKDITVLHASRRQYNVAKRHLKQILKSRKVTCLHILIAGHGSAQSVLQMHQPQLHLWGSNAKNYITYVDVIICHICLSNIDFFYYQIIKIWMKYMLHYPNSFRNSTDL